MRIEITLNSNAYAIDVDDKCYTAIKIGLTEAGKYKEEHLGYYSKLSNAALKCIREEIAMSNDAVSLKEFAMRVEALNKELTQQLDLIQA